LSRMRDLPSLFRVCLMALAVAIVPVSVSVNAQTLDTDAAQAAMLKRISAAVEANAKRIGAPGDLITYCRVELSLHTEHAADGLVPYGVNYYNIHSQAELDIIINVREAHERNYLMLCLARATQDLKAGAGGG